MQALVRSYGEFYALKSKERASQNRQVQGTIQYTVYS
jgi:hypothetical protein